MKLMRRMNLPRRFRKIDGTYVKHHCAAKTHTPSRCLWLTSINAFCNSLRLVHTPAFIVGSNSVVVVFFLLSHHECQSSVFLLYGCLACGSHILYDIYVYIWYIFLYPSNNEFSHSHNCMHSEWTDNIANKPIERRKKSGDINTHHKVCVCT